MLLASSEYLLSEFARPRFLTGDDAIVVPLWCSSGAFSMETPVAELRRAFCCDDFALYAVRGRGRSWENSGASKSASTSGSEVPVSHESVRAPSDLARRADRRIPLLAGANGAGVASVPALPGYSSSLSSSLDADFPPPGLSSVLRRFLAAP